MRYENELVGSYEIYYGLCRGKAKGRRRQVAGWIREQQGWKNGEEGGKGASHMQSGYCSVHFCDQTLCLMTTIYEILINNFIKVLVFWFFFFTV